MAVNFNLREYRALDPASDPLGRAWMGWMDDQPEHELWMHNRGVWNLKPALVDTQRLATLSFAGTIRIVVSITGAERVWDTRAKRWKTALVGEVLPAGNVVREALVGTALLHGDVSAVSLHDTARLDRLLPARVHPSSW